MFFFVFFSIFGHFLLFDLLLSECFLFSFSLAEEEEKNHPKEIKAFGGARRRHPLLYAKAIPINLGSEFVPFSSSKRFPTQCLLITFFNLDLLSIFFGFERKYGIEMLRSFLGMKLYSNATFG